MVPGLRLPLEQRSADNPLVEATATPVSLRNKRSQNGQGEDRTKKYDLDINCLELEDESFNMTDMGSDESILDMIHQSQLRTHECFTQNSTCTKNGVVSPPSLYHQSTVYLNQMIPQQCKRIFGWLVL